MLPVVTSMLERHAEGPIGRERACDTDSEAKMRGR